MVENSSQNLGNHQGHFYQYSSVFTFQVTVTRTIPVSPHTIVSDSGIREGTSTLTEL